MKQSITEEQWDEINEKEGFKFWIYGLKEHKKYAPGLSDLNFFIKDRVPTIGQMIEFLGNDLDSIENMHGSYLIYDNNTTGGTRNQYEEKELCDALWKLCKIKLNK